MTEANQVEATGTNGNRPIVYPFKRMLYSRKVMVAVIAVGVAMLVEYGLSAEIIGLIEKLAIAIIAGWTVKDAATNLANGKQTINNI